MADERAATGQAVDRGRFPMDVQVAGYGPDLDSFLVSGGGVPVVQASQGDRVAVRQIAHHAVEGIAVVVQGVITARSEVAVVGGEATSSYPIEGVVVMHDGLLHARVPDVETHVSVSVSVF